MPVFLVYLFSFIFLLFHQSQYIFGGDSAEFSLVAKTWSVAHPPGYPFYSLIINLINNLIPVGTTPWKIATVSSFSTVVTSYLVFILLRKIKIKPFIALFASLTYMILLPIWHYSEIPEVFALHNLLVILITFFLLSFIETGKRSYIYFAALICGICVSHHHIFVLFIPAWLYLLFQKNTKKITLKLLNKKDIIIFLALFLVGVSFYLYAPIASSFSPPLDWENAKTSSGFIRLITRAAYGTFKAYAGSTGNIVGQLYNVVSFFIFVFMDFRIIGAVFIALGIFFYPSKKRGFYGFLMIALITHLFFLFYTNFPLTTPFILAMYERFLIPPYLILIFFLAFGMQYVWIHFNELVRKHIHQSVLKKLSMAIFPVFIILYFSIIFFQNYRTIRHIPSLKIFAEFGKNLLDSPPLQSIFFVGGDNSHFTSLYYYFGEKYRNDLKFIFINLLNSPHYRDIVRQRYPEITIPKNREGKVELMDFVKANKEQGVYLGNSYGPSWIPYGLLWKYYETEERAISDSANLVRENTRLWREKYTIPRLNDDLKKILHLNVVQGQYLNAYFYYSRLLFATDHIKEAMEVLNFLSRFQKNDLRTKFIRVNLYLYEDNCFYAKKIIDTIPLEESLKQTHILPSLKDYYLKCEADNPSAWAIIRRIEKEQESAKSSISDL